MDHPILLAIAAALVVLGFLFMRWAGRYDAAGLAADAAWRMAKTRSVTGAQEELGRIVGERADEFRADAARIGRTRTVIKHGSGFLLARFVNLAGLILMIVGVGVGAAAFLI